MQNCICNPSFQKGRSVRQRKLQTDKHIKCVLKDVRKVLLESPTVRPYCDKVMSDYLSAYRPNFCTQHVLLRLIEEWRNFLDCNKVVGAIVTDLSKAFDCLPHDLLIAKLAAYGFDHNTIELIQSYLKNGKQSD